MIIIMYTLYKVVYTKSVPRGCFH